MKEICITQATEADLASIEPLILELIEAMYSPPDADVRCVLENCRALLIDPTHHILLAKVDDSVVGLINFTTRRTVVHSRPSGLIDELIVAKNHRGQGIGKRLVSAAIERCWELGYGEVEVSTEKANTAAREFYKKCGFKEDAVLLEKHLAD
jgi:GNAT superfamily N-acetyltransferase